VANNNVLFSGDCPRLCLELSTPGWLSHYLSLLEQPAGNEAGVYRQLHCLRLLQLILAQWGAEEEPRMPALVHQLFATLGRIALHCPGDASLLPTAEGKARVLLTASHSGSVAEELVALLRRLHTLPSWNPVINSFLAQKLCVAAELLAEQSHSTALDSEQVFVLGVLGAMGGHDLRPRVGLHCFHEGSHMVIASFTPKGRCLLAPGGVGSGVGFVKVQLPAVMPHLDHTVFSLSRLPMNEMLLNAWTVLLYGPAPELRELPSSADGRLDLALLRAQQLQMAVLHTNGVLYRHQVALRRILKQRAPGSIYASPDEPDRSDAESQQPGEQDQQLSSGSGQEPQLLIQCILLRATQASPVKACYSYMDLATAALNCIQSLATQAHQELSEGGGVPPNGRALSSPPQPTMVHGVPVYNVARKEQKPSEQVEQKSKWPAAATDAQLIGQIMEMGFTRRTVELALKQLSLQAEIMPTPEQIVQWILEHPDVCANTIEEDTLPLASSASSHDPEADSDNECPSSNSTTSSSTSSDTVEGQPMAVSGPAPPVKFESRKDFQTADLYALYVRGLVRPGMTVRCCRDFEEIKQGDMGTVLIVDTEGLHDLNVQVDWRNHGSTYWVCFVHIELVEAAQTHHQPRPPPSQWVHG